MANAIRRVSFFTASPVLTCDRCGQGIKNVAAVSYADDTVRHFGLDCIDKILAGDNSLRSLFNKHRKALVQHTHWLEVLQRPSMPRGSEYYGSGLYWVADDSGKDIMFGNFVWHPEVDWVRNAACPVVWYRQTEQEWAKKAEQGRTEMVAKLTEAIAKSEAFLAKVLRKRLVSA